jgi:hypothetical protein
MKASTAWFGVCFVGFAWLTAVFDSLTYGNAACFDNDYRTMQG